MAENYTGAKGVYGLNIYHLKNQTIYYDWIEKTAYIIPNSRVNTFTKWQIRIPVFIVIGCIFILLKANVIATLATMLVTIIVSGILFRKKYLPDFPISSKFVKPEAKGLNKIAQFYPRDTFRSLSMMFGFMVIIMLILAFVINKYDGINAIVSWIFIGICFILFIITFLLMKTKDKAAK